MKFKLMKSEVSPTFFFIMNEYNYLTKDGKMVDFFGAISGLKSDKVYFNSKRFAIQAIKKYYPHSEIIQK